MLQAPNYNGKSTFLLIRSLIKSINESKYSYRESDPYIGLALDDVFLSIHCGPLITINRSAEQLFSYYFFSTTLIHIVT